MRIPRIVDAMNYIDDDLISEAIEFRRKPIRSIIFRKLWLKVCACFLVAALVFGVSILHNGDKGGIVSPFVLTAYAKSNDDVDVESNFIIKGKKVPISTFETENGLTGFVVSCNKTDDNTPSSITIIGTDNNSQKRITEIRGIIGDPTQNYYFYVLGENSVEPYSFPIVLTDIDTNLICQYKVTITQTDNVYYAELSEEKIMERVVSPTTQN